jgi:hypothetical protein
MFKHLVVVIFKKISTVLFKNFFIFIIEIIIIIIIIEMCLYLGFRIVFNFSKHMIKSLKISFFFTVQLFIKIIKNIGLIVLNSFDGVFGPLYSVKKSNKDENSNYLIEQTAANNEITDKQVELNAESLDSTIANQSNQNETKNEIILKNKRNCRYCRY